MNLENDHFKLRINVGRRSEIKEHTVELEGILDIMAAMDGATCLVEEIELG